MSLTIIIIVFTVIISFQAWNKPNMMQKMLFNPFIIQRKKEYWRFLTSGFIHGSYMHLGFNMFTFYFFGSTMEQVYKALFGPVQGSIYFLLLLLLGIVIADIPTFFKHRDHPHYNALGASGGVSSVVFASILFFPLNDICLFAVLCIPGFILGILYVLYSYFQGKNMSDNINHEAHLYGALFGIVFAIVSYPSVVMSFIEQIMSFRIF